MVTRNPGRLAPNPYTDRAERALAALLTFSGSLDQNLKEVRHLYDNGPRGGPRIVVARVHVRGALLRWRNETFNSEQLRAWAQAINLHHGALVKRPYLGYMNGSQAVLTEVISQLGTTSELPYSAALIDKVELRLDSPIEWLMPEPWHRRVWRNITRMR